jgi:RNA polymerase sigma factor (sigma-70 family)
MTDPPIETPPRRGADAVDTREPGPLDALFRRERQPLVRVAVLLVGSAAQAEEIVQDAFAVVGERWDAIDNPGGYLRTTVVNGCRMALRRRALEQRHPGDVPVPVDGPAELVELHGALDALGERARTAIVLRYFVGLSDSEIATVLDCRVATVRSTIHRELRALRKELS